MGIVVFPQSGMRKRGWGLGTRLIFVPIPVPAWGLIFVPVPVPIPIGYMDFFSNTGMPSLSLIRWNQKEECPIASLLIKTPTPKKHYPFSLHLSPFPNNHKADNIRSLAPLQLIENKLDLPTIHVLLLLSLDVLPFFKLSTMILKNKIAWLTL